jgi:hypothetical protein
MSIEVPRLKAHSSNPIDDPLATLFPSRAPRDSEQIRLEINLEKVRSAKSKDQLESEIKLAALEVDKLKLRNEQDNNLRVIDAITTSITRVAAVLIALYLIKILMGVMRYFFRIADHFSSVADATLLCEGRTAEIKDLIGVLSPNHVDFGEAPATPGGEIKDVVDKLVTKLENMVRPQAKAP